MLAIARFERRENRKKNKAEASSVAEEVITCTAETAEADIQTDIVGDHIIAMELELQELRAEHFQLKERIKADNAPFNFSFFEGNNDKVLFFLPDCRHGTFWQAFTHTSARTCLHEKHLLSFRCW